MNLGKSRKGVPDLFGFEDRIQNVQVYRCLYTEIQCFLTDEQQTTVVLAILCHQQKSQVFSFNIIVILDVLKYHLYSLLFKMTEVIRPTLRPCYLAR